MISQNTIQRIFNNIDISQIISEYVSLITKGDTMIGICPFEQESQTYFTVYPRMGMFKCFECGCGGNVINFVMAHEKMSYEEAVRFLANKFGIEVEEDSDDISVEEFSHHQSLLQASDWAGRYFKDQLLNTDQGNAIGLSYFHMRGIDHVAIEKFDLGYCPSGKNQMTLAATKEGYDIEVLEETGLTIKRDNWIRDRFEDRVIFPIHNLTGRVIAFGGRVMGNADNIAKYLNSPESDIYHKSYVLYGLHLAKEQIKKENKCYIVEGYTDVISVSCAGITNVVASAGTSLTTYQVRLLRRFTDTITLIYDGDSAGISASIRGVSIILKEGMNVKVVSLPDGEDPDSFARNRSSEEFASYLKSHEIDFIEFASKIRSQQTLNDPIARAGAITEIVRLIAIIPYLHVRVSYVKECSSLMNIKEEDLYRELRRYQRENSEKYFRKKEQEKRMSSIGATTSHTILVNNPCEKEEKEVLRFLLRYGNKIIAHEPIEDSNYSRPVSVAKYIIHAMEEDELRSVDPVIQAVFDDYKAQDIKFNFEPERYFINHPNREIAALCSDLLADKYQESTLWTRKGSYVEKIDDILITIVPRVVEEYKLKSVRMMISTLMSELQNIDINANFDRVIEIQQRIQLLKQAELLLSQSLGQRIINK